MIQVHINSSGLWVAFMAIYVFKEHENTQRGALHMLSYLSKTVLQGNAISIFYRK